MRNKSLILTILLSVYLNAQPVPTTINDFFLPGSQPNQSGVFNSLPGNCGCHAGYDINVEPMYTWKGNMMSQAQRDPLYLASLTIANQDAAFSGDLCIRCHSPRGWLSGRSIPTDGSLLNAGDRESVYCDFCHRAVKPSQIGVNPYPANTEYTNATYPADQIYLSKLTLPNNRPDSSANGMYLIDDDETRRGPYTESDAQANHAERYSPFHRDALMCATCHDVSNPVYSKQLNGTYLLNSLNTPSPSFDPYSMFPVERTFSEWMMSEYNSSTGVYAPQFGGNKDYVSTCQDCHMRDVTGKGCDKPSAPIRTDLGLHDMTGGNTFIPTIVPILYPGEVSVPALNAGILRATYMLENAVEMEFIGEPVRLPDDSVQIEVKITNNTGHKLPSGYPEGRRIWINIKGYDIEDSLIFESGYYDYLTGNLVGDNQIKIYEIKPGLTEATATALGKVAGPSFHFVLNDTIYKDNRIPPRGFTNQNFTTIQSPPVSYNYADGQYWDLTTYKLHPSTKRFTATLLYQTVSKDYIEFLKNNNTTDNRGLTMFNLWNENGKSAPVIMKIINGTVTNTTFQMMVNISDGWNMVSIPGLHPTDQNVNTWWSFRDLVANVFRYAGGYQSVTEAVPGTGYWMKHAGDRVYNTGDEWPAGGIQIVAHDPLAGASGWNLFGGYELSVTATNVTTNPPGLQSGPIYKYAGGYSVATTIDPGYGYWIKLNSAGQIIIPEAMAKGSATEYFPEDWGRIIISDATGTNYTLYSVKGEVDLSQYDLPPTPPTGMFDIRFSSGRIAEDVNSSVKTIDMSGVTYPLTVRVEGMDIRLMDETGKNVNVNLKAGEDMVIIESTIQKLIVSGELLPTVCSLEQNYPNPFNPSTVIKYSLKNDGLVKLAVYNLLGEEVALFVNTEQKAGIHEINFDAGKLASGVYVYRIVSENFTASKKLMLIK